MLLELQRSDISACNDKEPAFFLRDVTAYIAQSQSVKILERRSLSYRFLMARAHSS